MEYRIEYTDKIGKRHKYVNSRKNLIEMLKLLKGKSISDIRKIDKNGNSQTVMDIYQNYIKR
ncbi:MAG: hypothetical protein NC094_12060 [Bacteroidales bacterium]|nr:hypothetical protein [Lachnoclostridium sp.]MCM1385270.1 hypothetical protein [Lachnoclostridium sp.]MCM1466144.1 hypothetical protein [Bacteroidales bacterium]